MSNKNVWQQFVDASNFLYNQTHGIIEFDGGKSAITKTGAAEFAQSAISLLTEDGTLDKPDVEALKNPKKISGGLVDTFAMALADPGKSSYINNHRALYSQAIDEALREPIIKKMASAIVRERIAKGNIFMFTCARENSNLDENTVKRRILEEHGLREQGLTAENIIVLNSRKDYELASRIYDEEAQKRSGYAVSEFDLRL